MQSFLADDMCPAWGPHGLAAGTVLLSRCSMCMCVSRAVVQDTCLAGAEYQVVPGVGTKYIGRRCHRGPDSTRVVVCVGMQCPKMIFGRWPHKSSFLFPMFSLARCYMHVPLAVHMCVTHSSLQAAAHLGSMTWKLHWLALQGTIVQLVTAHGG